MAISRKPRNTNDSDENMFDAPTAQLFEDIDHEDNPAPQQDDKYDQLAKTLADIQARLVEAERTNMTLLTNTTRQEESYTSAGDPSKIKLPDPAIDPDGFAAAVTQRNEILIENKQREDAFKSKRMQETRDKVDNLWSEFANSYPSMADDQKRIDYIANKVAAEARSRGVDVERYMFVTRSKFLDDVANEYIDIFGDPSEDEEDNNEQENSRRHTRQRRASSNSNNRRRTQRRDRQEDDYVERTGGIFGGNESGGRLNSRDDERLPDMIDDIHAIQKKTGFF